MNFDRVPFAWLFLDFFGEQDFVTYVMAAPGYGSQKISFVAESERSVV